MLLHLGTGVYEAVMLMLMLLHLGTGVYRYSCYLGPTSSTEGYTA